MTEGTSPSVATFTTPTGSAEDCAGCVYRVFGDLLRPDGLRPACPAFFEFGEGPDSDFGDALSAGLVDSCFGGSLLSDIGDGLDGRAVRLGAKVLSVDFGYS